jgi:hypothetical protein
MMRNASSASALGLSTPRRAWASTKGVVEEVGGVFGLAVRTLVAAVRPPYPYGAELVHPGARAG